MLSEWRVFKELHPQPETSKDLKEGVLAGKMKWTRSRNIMGVDLRYYCLVHHKGVTYVIGRENNRV